MRAASSAAALRARAASREPMVTAWPAAARRKATPLPCAPVQPRIAILYFCRSNVVSSSCIPVDPSIRRIRESLCGGDSRQSDAVSISVSDDEQVFDRNAPGNEVLFGHVLHQRVEGRPVGLDP